MNILPLLFTLSLAGCAAPIEKVMIEAKECVSNHINEKGVIGKPSDDERRECWSEYNRREDIRAERKVKKLKEKKGNCSVGYVLWCQRDSCGCISEREMREALRSFGY